MTETATKIAGLLREHLDPLALRLRGPAIAALAGRLAETGVQPGLTPLVASVPRVVGRLNAEHAAVLLRVATMEAEVHAASDPAAQRQALARIVWREVSDPRRRRGDLRAIGRDLDLDALRERMFGELAAIEAQVELALGFIGRATAATVASDPESAPSLRRTGLSTFLLAQVTWVPRFGVRLAAVTALQRICEVLGGSDPDRAIARAMTARVLDPEEHPWVQVTALGVLFAVAPREGLRLAAEILRAPHAGGGDAQGGVYEAIEAMEFEVIEGAEDLAAASHSRNKIVRLARGERGPDGSWPDLSGDAAAWDSVTAGAVEGEQPEGPGVSRNTGTGSRWVSLGAVIDAEASTPAGSIGLVVRPTAATSGAAMLLRLAGGRPPRDGDRERRAVAGEIGEARDVAASGELAGAEGLVEGTGAVGLAEGTGSDGQVAGLSDSAAAIAGLSDSAAAIAGLSGSSGSGASISGELGGSGQTFDVHEAGASTGSGAWAMLGEDGAPAAVTAEREAEVAVELSATRELDEAQGLCDAGAPAPMSAGLRGRRAFLLRRLVVELLARRIGEGRSAAVAVDLLAEAIATGDPSEHVRVGLAVAVGALPVQAQRAGRMLAAMADPGREASAVVRAAALRAGAPGPASDVLLARCLAEESSPLVLRIACAEAGTRGGAELVGALVRLSERDDRPAPVHEAAAAALEAIDRQADPSRAAWTSLLAQALANTRPGGQTRVPLERDDMLPHGDARWFGRIFAELTRADWGVDVTFGRAHLTIRRGDRWRLQVWRVLHELRNPGPNKRQAFSHTRGRVLRGELRAHSGLLHEVTGTGVPGERVQCEREGGWGRHLPLVDDLLGMPLLRARPVQVVSSQGTCTIVWRRGLLGRVAGRLRLVARYAWLSELRQQALSAEEPAQRGRYALALRAGFGIELRFVGHRAPRSAAAAVAEVASPGLAEGLTGDPETLQLSGSWLEGQARRLPQGLRALFPASDGPLQRLPPIGASRAAAASWLVAPELVQWVWSHAPYFLSVSANSQQALAYFLAALACFGLVAAYLRNRGIASDRAAVPLVIGGWGTRGKSGTERLKAGLLHGLGYSVFAKTTGCEAMFIHAPPLGPAREIYSFRPYGKATIWEQRTLLGLASRMHSEVFLWECMALSPAYVQILQHSWMRDDFSTITNAYPDHEDLQGPAGIDVAEVIAGFVPTKGRLVTSEINFLPVLQEAARRRETPLCAVPELAGELLPADLLALFPYDEHPRNVALVAHLATLLGVDPTLAIVTMAEHVVPDLGVLKRFGPARVRGRALEFINGCSANERTGFLSNWRRTGCDALDLASEPDRYIITVVNNRDDRVSRSQVFARVLVEDVAVDRHVVIGSNTQGLLGYMRAALAEFLAEQPVVTPEDLSAGTSKGGQPGRRLDALLARLRVLPRTPEALAQQLEIFARGAGRVLAAADRAETAERCAPWLVADAAASLELAGVLAQVRAELATWAEGLLASAPQAGPQEPPEVDVPASLGSAASHFVRQVARTAIAARLHARLAAALRAGEAAIEAFHAALRGAYTELFLELVDVVEDPATTGDQVVLRCALAVPPGVRALVMGTQNIKGTGLDFVYRWIALDVAQHDLSALASKDPETRSLALRRLASPDDPGLMDAGLVAARLAARTPGAGEAALQGRAQEQAEARHAARRAALVQRARRGRGDALLGWLEGWVDFLDGARRHHRAKQVMRDLVDQRISHARAARAMRELDARAKGGWLVKATRGA